MLTILAPVGVALAQSATDSPPVTTSSSTVPTTPPVLSSIYATNITAGSAQIRWHTDRLANSMVDYGAMPGNYVQFSSSRCDAGGFLTDHCVNIMGLVSGTIYLRARSMDTNGLEGKSAEISLGVPNTTSVSNTLTSTTPPILMSVRAENVIGPTAQIRWQTDRPASSLVDYGTAPGNFTQSASSRCDAGGLTTDHCVNLTGLTAGAIYYRARSLDASNAEGQFSGSSFTSAGYSSSPQTTTASTSLQPVPPNNVNAFGSGSSVTVSWLPPTVPVSEIKIYHQSYTTGWTYIATTDFAHTSYTENNLPPGTYQYQLVACAQGVCSVAATSPAVTIASPVATTTVTSTTATPATSAASGSVPTVTLKTNGGSYGPVSLPAPATYTIYWTTTGNPTSCQPEGTWSGSGAKYVPAGSWDFSGVSVLGPKTYTLNCSNAYGSSRASITINIVAGTAAATSVTSTNTTSPTTTSTSTPTSATTVTSTTSVIPPSTRLTTPLPTRSRWAASAHTTSSSPRRCRVTTRTRTLRRTRLLSETSARLPTQAPSRSLMSCRTDWSSSRVLVLSGP